MSWWIRGTEIIDRVDDAASHEMKPKSVHLRPREERVVGRGDPVGDRFESVHFGRQIRAGAEHSRRGGSIGLRVRHFTVERGEDVLLSFELVQIIAIDTTIFDDRVVDSRKDASPMVIVSLRPTIEGMVVTFC